MSSARSGDRRAAAPPLFPLTDASTSSSAASRCSCAARRLVSSTLPPTTLTPPSGWGGCPGTVLPVALSELRNRVVELRTALGSEAVALYDLMMRASNASRPDLVLSELLVEQAEPWVTTAHRLARTGAPAREAARALDWSERTLRRRMLETFGYGYTTLARIERVFRARSLLQRGLSPAHVSATTGYADQPHLTREFVRMVGATPAQFSKAAKRSTLLPSGSSTVA